MASSGELHFDLILECVFFVLFIVKFCHSLRLSLIWYSFLFSLLRFNVSGFFINLDDYGTVNIFLIWWFVCKFKALYGAVVGALFITAMVL